jgi:hypothetical protein
MYGLVTILSAKKGTHDDAIPSFFRTLSPIFFAPDPSPCSASLVAVEKKKERKKSLDTVARTIPELGRGAWTLVVPSSFLLTFFCDKSPFFLLFLAMA